MAVRFLPRLLFSIMVEDAAVQPTLEALIRANQTGEYGDGRIFVMPLSEAYRISAPLYAEFQDGRERHTPLQRMEAVAA
jgi:nitrogen regulatory protein PII